MVLTLTEPDLHDDVVALRRPAPSDVDAITAAVQDPDIPRFTMVPSPYSVADAVAFVDRAAGSWRAGTDASFVVVERASGTLLGAIGLHQLDRALGQAQVGYWVERTARGRGVATRALRLVTGWAFGSLGLRRLQAFVFTDNPGSARVLEKAGYRLAPDAPTPIEHAAGPRVARRYAQEAAGA